MELSNVDRRVIGVWRCYAALASGAATLGACFLGAELDLILPLVAPVFAAGAMASWLWPPLSYHHLTYGVDATGVAIERGVLWRSRIFLPRSRIQHTDVSQGPLQRRFGVATLKLYTAGSRHTLIELPGLAHGRALAMRNALLTETRDSGV